MQYHIEPIRMKFLILLLLTVVGRAIPIAAQDGTWQKVSVEDSVTVAFPSNPKKVVQPNQIAYSLYADGVLYSLAIQRDAADPGTTIEEKRQFYEKAIQGAVERLHAKQVNDKSRFVVNGFEGLEATFVSGHAKLKNPVSMRMILVNDIFYGQLFSASPDSAHAIARAHFFASFVPQIRPAAVTPAETHTAAYRYGQLIGKLAVYGLIIGGIIFLLTRSSATKKNKQTT